MSQVPYKAYHITLGKFLLCLRSAFTLQCADWMKIHTQAKTYPRKSPLQTSLLDPPVETQVQRLLNQTCDIPTQTMWLSKGKPKA